MSLKFAGVLLLLGLSHRAGCVPLNLNKLFPRLSIRAKLVIAFVALAVFPLLIVGTVGLISAITELRASARAELAYDLDVTFLRTSRALREAEQHTSFLTEAGLGSILLEPDSDPEEARAVTEAFLRVDSSAVFRVKVIDEFGEVILRARRPGPPEGIASPESEPFYAWAAAGLEPDDRVFLPVEFGLEGADTTGHTVPAVAVLVPVHDEGGFRGVVVGEAEAATLFEGLDRASPSLDGTTGLVDEEGLFLYHSELKSDWSSLLSARVTSGLRDEFPAELAERMLTESAGVDQTEDGTVVGFRRIAIGHPQTTALILYRAVPLGVMAASVRRFLLLALLLGAAIVAVVTLLAALAADQISRPIYRLRAGAAAVSKGDSLEPLSIETNDELEDLARDFTSMAGTLERHRHHLEELVEERTRDRNRAETELHLVLNSSADAIVGLDTEQRVRLWNHGAAELFGYAAGEAAGRPLDELIGPGPDEALEEQRFLASTLDSMGSVINYRTNRRAKGGTQVPVSLTETVLVGEDGRPAGLSLIFRDDRAQRNLDEQMRRSERLAAVSVMAAGLAHELNNPLAVLGNRIELMQREAAAQGGGEQLQRDLEVLRQHVGRLGGITSDLLRFARDDSGEIGPVDVAEIVERVGRLLRRVFVASDLALHIELGDDVPAVSGNETVVETVLVNLLLNAQQATPAGGRIDVITRLGSADGFVDIVVRDTGPGIPVDLRRRIF